mmetsp:Transcript_41788/g.55075  ORF Transcript_41788/g.55075 Transcript_41788/m.55075 type:complete len:90 (+) Transcript_41788:51-320(+)
MPENEPIYAGFYANLVKFHNSTIIVFSVEFLLLFAMAISMYIFYLRERRLKSKIKFKATTADGDSSPVTASKRRYSSQNQALLNQSSQS